MRSKSVTKLGIPVNLSIAFVIGFLTANNSIETGISISDSLVFWLAAGLITQEVILVQIFSLDANREYQNRLLKGDVSTSRRLQMLLIPFLIITILGFLSLYYSERSFDQYSAIRVVAISIIFTLGIDPLFGLTDRDYLALFGAAIVYLLIIGSAIRGFDNLVELFELLFGEYVSISLSSVIFCYLLLSIRWTYYRLFCFDQIEQPTHIVLESLIPVLLILLPSAPDLFSLIKLIYTGA